MTSFLTIAAAAAGIVMSACGGRTVSSDTTRVVPLSSATVVFVTGSDGKDADSAVTLQLLRNNAELAAEMRTTGTKFDDNRTSGPMALSMAGPFSSADVDDGQLRIRMTPDGRDDWNFDLRLTLTFADGTSRNFRWTNIELDNDTPERALALAPARVP